MEKLSLIDESSHTVALVRVARAVASTELPTPPPRAEALRLLEALEALVAALVGGEPSPAVRATAAAIARTYGGGARL